MTTSRCIAFPTSGHPFCGVALIHQRCHRNNRCESLAIQAASRSQCVFGPSVCHLSFADWQMAIIQRLMFDRFNLPDSIDNLPSSRGERFKARTERIATRVAAKRNASNDGATPCDGPSGSRRRCSEVPPGELTRWRVQYARRETAPFSAIQLNCAWHRFCTFLNSGRAPN